MTLMAYPLPKSPKSRTRSIPLQKDSTAPPKRVSHKTGLSYKGKQTSA